MILIAFDYDTNQSYMQEFSSPGKISGEFIAALIGCDALDCIRLPYGVDMWVDDEYLLKPYPANLHASAICKYTWHDKNFPVIYGNVVLAGVNEDGETIDLTEEQRKYIMTLVKGLTK